MSRATHPVMPGPGLPASIAGYRVDRHLGQGSTADVYLAQDERLHRQVALKVIPAELARDIAFSDQVIRESRAAAALDHPHVLPVYDAGLAGGSLYVAMHYAAGGSARSLLGRSGPLPLDYACEIIAQIASALDAAHRHGLVHRDVRPANILFDAAASPGDQAYLADFGLSRHVPPEYIIATGHYTGTLDYAAPEQIEGHAVDGRADVYSLAYTGFELLCGTPPFGHDQGLTVMYAHLYAPPPRAAAMRTELPAAVDRVLATALAKNPADRFPSCGEFAGELRSALGLSPGAARPPATGARQPPATGAGQPPATGARQPPATGAGQPPATGARQPPAAPGWPPAAGPDWRVADTRPEPAAREPEPSAWQLPGEPSAQRRSGLKLALVAAAALVIASPVAVGLVLSQEQHSPAASAASAASAPARSPSPSPSPSAPASASGQAAAVSTLLASSAATRTALHDAVRQAGACANLSGAVSQLQGVVDRRTAQSRQASALVTAALPDGATVKSDLIAALNSSLDSDRDYLTWARQRMASGCASAGPSAAYAAAVGASQQADAAKLTFVRAWNPVAARYGLKPISPASF